MKKITLLWCIMLIVSFTCFAQNDNWIIGNSGRLNFSSNPPAITSISGENGTNLPVNSIGYTSVSDGCGKLLFTTDGQRVYTYNNGNYYLQSETFAESPRTDVRQNVAIVPRPNYLNNFYIFTVTDTEVYCTEYYVNDDGLSGYVANSFTLGMQCTALTAIVARTCGSCGTFTDKIMLFNQTDKSIHTYFINEDGIDFGNHMEYDISSYIPTNSFVNNLISYDIGIGDSYVLSTNLGNLIFFKFFNSGTNNPVFVPFGSVGSEVKGISFSGVGDNNPKLYIATENGLYKTIYNGGTTVFGAPAEFISGDFGDLQMGNDGKIYGAIEGSSSLIKIDDPTNYSNPNITTFPLGFVNSNSHLGQLTVRNPNYSLINLIKPTFTQIGPVCYGTTVTLPTTSNNGKTGTWSPAFNKYSSSTYNFTPNSNQCADITKMTITVNQLPKITLQPTIPQSTCTGTGTQTISVTATGSGLTYSWKRNGLVVANNSIINGQGTRTLTLTNPTEANAGAYTVVVSGTCTPAVTSNPVQVTVNSIVTPTFASVTPINSGGTLSALPTTSNNNNITGTWSPALDNTKTTIYTFNPTVGQCSKSTTLEIIVLPPTAPSSTFEYNYIKKKNYKIASTTSLQNATPDQVLEQITYFDGLGRTVQQKLIKQSHISNKDIVIPIANDAFPNTANLQGTEYREYLPYVNTASSDSYESNAIADQTYFYGTRDSQHFESTGNAYSQKTIENSPLGRLKNIAAPGYDWKASENGTDTDHTIKFEYLTNTTDEVKLFKATSTETANLYSISLTDGGYYEQNQLYKSITKNENWTSAENGTNKNNTTEEFKDKLGRVVLKRVYGESIVNNAPVNEQHDTYYIYDQYGNLTYVIPPKVDVNNGVPSEDVLKKLCYSYKYDYRNRLVEKQLPGKNLEFILYDKLDRVVATGPVLSPFTDNPTALGWMIVKYDVFNRVVTTGWMPYSTFDVTNIKSLQNTTINGQDSFNETKSGTSYTDDVWPTSGTYQKLTINYYDDYNTNLSFTPAISYPTESYYNNTIKPKGLPTMSWVLIPETTSTNPPRAERTYILYDKKGQAIVSFKNNYLNGYTKVASQLQPITGRVNQTVTSHKKSSNDTALTITDNFTYSDQDRLLTHTQQIGSKTELISKNDYSPLGELISKRVGSKTIGDVDSGIQKVDYSYTARGWLKGINNTENLLEGSEVPDLFAFKINYNTVDSQSSDAEPQYNGNIAEISWKTNDNITRRYNYTYDKLNRLTNAVYSKPTSGAVPENSNSYGENINYDKNGNITHLDRFGGNDDYGMNIQIDNLQYSYDTNSNKLLKVFDDTDNSSGFNDDTDGTQDPEDDYDYDDYGNLKKDQNKGIVNGSLQAITYNHLNLPKKISFGSTDKIEYLYNAVGAKIKKTVTKGSTVTTTDYLDGFQYTGNMLEFSPHAEGYVKNEAGVYKYVFNYTDHLGNIRMSFYSDPVTQLPVVLQENNYYPFGMKHDPYNGDNDQEYYKYKYNGKEYENGNDLNMTEMDYRQYDNALGRFNVIDPLAELSYSQTPYHFGNNNPVYFSDPSGLKPNPGRSIWNWLFGNYVGYDKDYGGGRRGSGGSFWGDGGDNGQIAEWRAFFAELQANALYNNSPITGGGGGGGGSGGGFSGGFGDPPKRKLTPKEQAFVDEFLANERMYKRGLEWVYDDNPFSALGHQFSFALPSARFNGLFSIFSKTKNITTAEVGAYKTALEGGKHSGFLKNYMGRSAAEINKAINTLRIGKRGINTHLDKIANPSKYVSNWSTLNLNHQQSLINGWQKEITNANEQIQILKGLLGN